MIRIVRAVVFASCLLVSANVFAQSGTLRLETVFSGGHQLLTVEHIGNDYAGTLVTNGVPENVFVIQLSNGWQFSVGSGNEISDSFVLTAQRWVNGGTATSTTLTGNVSQGRNVEFFATYKANRDVWLYDGTIGLFADLTGKGQADQLNLSWNRSRLQIRSTGSGGCAGETRSGNAVTHSFVCATSGTLTDAFFLGPLGPDHVLLWLINMYAKQ